MKIFLIAILCLLSYLGYSQSSANVKDLRFSGLPPIITKITTDLNTTDSLLTTAIPNTNSVYQWVKNHSGSGPGGSYYTKTQIDSIFATLVTDTLKTRTTTNATPSNMDTISLPNNYMAVFDVVIQYHNSSTKSDAGKAHREVTIINAGGVYSVYNDLIATDHAATGISAASFNTIQLVAGGPVSFQLTGIAATTIIWTMQRGIKYHQLN